MRKSFASPVLTFSDRSTKRTQLVLGQVAVGAGLEHSELHTADGDTAQSADLKTYCGAHAAYLATDQPFLLPQHDPYRACTQG